MPPVLDAGGKARRAPGYRSSKSPLSPRLHRLEQLHVLPLLGAQAKADSTSHHIRRPCVGVMHDGRAEVDEQVMFVHEYFDSVHFHIVFLLCD